MPKARLVFDGDNIYTEKDARIYKLKTSVSSKIDAIPGVVDSLDSTSATDALSANMGRQLQDQINSLSGTGKFLSTWDCTTGLPGTNPQEDPYTYKIGDYYVVSATGSTNYKPHGGTYTQGVPSTTVELENVGVNDKYYFDGADWVRIPDTAIQIGIDTALSTTSTNAVENRAIANAINTKQNIISDLNDIRSGAAAGSTALQRLANISELTNNLGYQTAGDVASAIAGKANTSDVTALAGRVTTAEGKISTLETSSADYASRISSLETSSGGASQDIADLQGDVTSIQGDITSIQGDISSLQTTVSGHTTSINTLQGDVTSIEGDISDLQDAVAGITIPSVSITNNSNIISATVSGQDGHTITISDTANAVTKQYVDDSIIEYNAGEGIEIKNGPDYSAMQGPAPSGYHVPLIGEINGLITIMSGLGISTGDEWRIKLHLPFAGGRNYSDANLYSQGNYGYYLSSSASSSVYKWYLILSSSNISTNGQSYRSFGHSVRCFKDSYATPDSTWTVVQGTLGSAGIFWNQSEGLISITNGTTGYTMMDKNLGATTVYNDGDTLSEANCGKYYQWGNNYGFPRTGSVTTSSSGVDASSYGPGKYYSSSTFITGTDWSSVKNDNLRGGETGVVTFNNAISVDADAIKNISVSGASTGTFLRAAQAAGVKHTIDMGTDRTYTFQGVGYILIDNWMGWELVINGIVIFSEEHSSGTYEYKHPSSIYTMGPGDVVRMRRPGSRGSRGGEVADFY